ncbi:hypothetical protein [Thioflexithrix psekupsensis]|uniref:Uncharacterized protein n=1 Tax=Thioflexithrix psekupsensis TaxID=1570016 RepID=A0A251X952_9GAMM|nr:hypothetical protein [Thioflexithrix psekupsensis]OUD14257.1 hypothetical protein TPSD3_07990 [Thioflexithrix psekupsensis]
MSNGNADVSISPEDVDVLKKLGKLFQEKSIEKSPERYEDDLERKFNLFMEETPEFKKGDIVRWKKGLKNKKYPKEDQLCKVVEVLKEPIIEESRDSGSPYYREPLDLILALLDSESGLLVFHYDKRRFELVRRANDKS